MTTTTAHPTINYLFQENEPACVPIASLPTSPSISAFPSVTLAASNGPPNPPIAPTTTTKTPTTTRTLESLTAGIKRGLARMYLADLCAWRSDDNARFTRMVAADGKQICSPESFLRNLANICAHPAVVQHAPDLPAHVAERLAALGLALPGA